MTVQRFLRFFAFGMIPLSILGPAIMSPKFGPIHLLPQWLFIIIALPTLLLLIMGEDFRIRLPLNIKTGVRIKPYIWFLVVWMGYAMLSLLWTENTLYGLKMLVVFCITISFTVLLTMTIVAERDVELVLRWYIAILLINYAVVCLELGYGYHLPSSNIVQLGRSGIQVIPQVGSGMLGIYEGRITGTFYNTNSLGTFLGLTIPLIFSNFVLGSRRWLIKIPAFLLCAGGIWLSIYINSRVYFLVIIITTMIYLLTVKNKYKPVVLMAAGSIGWFLAVYVVPSFSLSTDVSFRLRVEYLSIGLSRFLHSFLLLGTGVGSFSDYCIHNLYAEILFKFGPFIALGYIVLYVSILINLHRISKERKTHRMSYMAQGFFVSLCGYTVGCLADSSVMSSFGSWIIIGASLALINIYRNNAREQRSVRTNRQCEVPFRQAGSVDGS